MSQTAEQLKLCVSTVAGFVSRVDASPFGVTRRVSTFMSPTSVWWENRQYCSSLSVFHGRPCSVVFGDEHRANIAVAIDTAQSDVEP